MDQLSRIESDLAAHFSALSSPRAEAGFLTYAIEHPVNAADIEDLKHRLSDQLGRQYLLSEDYWLSWVIVAAEIGYVFDGDEYWDTFADEIPNWRLYGDRRKIRRWFRKFAKQYGGYRPSGRWASHFSIIAWPITHAILPQDLQVQFARTIYEARFDLADVAHMKVTKIGEQIRDAPYHHSRSSRFAAILEQTDLIGHLVLGLRDEDIHSGVSRLHAPTLKRLVCDLERTQHAKEWLREARTVLRDGRTRLAASLVSGKQPPRSATKTTHGSILLIAKQASSGVWQIGLSLPDFASLASSLNVDLKRTDTLVAFAGETTALPARALLALSNVPRPIAQLSRVTGRPAISFEPVAPWTDRLADACFVQDQAQWLLRLQSDGWAREVRGHHVRVDEEYLLVCGGDTTAHIAECLQLERVSTNLSDRVVYLLKVPSVVSQEYDKALNQVGLGRVLMTVVEPLGLVPRRTGDVDSIAWLATEEPTFLLRSDAEDVEFVVSVDGDLLTRIVPNGGPTIVAIKGLSLGKHQLRFGCAAGTGGHAQANEGEELEIEIRAPTPWSVLSSNSLGFRIGIDPDDAKIDELIAGSAALAVVAPEGRTGLLAAKTYSATGNLQDNIELGALKLPASTHTLRQRLGKLGVDPASQQIHQSTHIELSLTLEELGTQSIHFTRRVEPIRWSLRRDGDGYLVRLIDDAASDEAIEFSRYDVSSPDTRRSLDVAECAEGVSVASPGALFSARLGKRRFAAAFSVAPHAVSTLSALGVGVIVSSENKLIGNVPRLLALLRLWRKVRWQGQLVLHRRAAVLHSLEMALAEAICGSKWVQLLEHGYSDPNSNLRGLQVKVGGSPGFAHRMRKTNFLSPVDGSSPENAFVRWAVDYKIASTASDARLAFRLAFAPETIKADNPGERIDFAAVAANRSLCKGAFLARLASSRIVDRERMAPT